MTLRRAVFLDRDGVIIEDTGGLARDEALVLLPGAAEAIALVNRAGLDVVVVTNQPIVARGTVTEDEVRARHDRLARLLAERGARVDAFFFCPHHPNATVATYRLACACRKPRPGLLLDAARERGLDLGASFMIGDRLSDIAAGKRAGCRTALVTSGRHGDPPIESPDAFADVEPDVVAADVLAAVRALGAVG